MAQTEQTQAYSSACLRYDTMLGKTIGGPMTCTGMVSTDQLIICISRNTTTGVPTDRLTTATLTTDAFTSTANLSSLPCEVLWADTSA